MNTFLPDSGTPSLPKSKYHGAFGRRVGCMLRRPKAFKHFACSMNFFMALIREHVPIQEKLAASGKRSLRNPYFDSNAVFIFLSMH